MIGRWPGAVAGLLGLLLAAAGPVPAAELTPAEERGKRIFLDGESPSGGQIVAVLGDSGTEVPAAVMPCGSCHGRDGRGRPEGGVSPSNLTWQALTKSYGVEHPGGRRHPPYDEARLKRAITLGTDPAGNELHVAMPRYRLSHGDLEDLVAYLEVLGQDPDPGVEEGAVRIATQLPREGPLASLGEAMEAALGAYFDDLNHRGGVYQRRLELRVIPAPPEPAARAAELRRALEEEETFALVGSFLPGAEAEVTDLVAELEVPLVGPFTLHPREGLVTDPHVFYLLPGLEQLAGALLSHTAAAASGGPTRGAVVTDGDPDFEAAAEELVRSAAGLGWPELRRSILGEPGAVAEELAAEGVEALFLLTGGEERAELLREAAARGWYPKVLVPGTAIDGGVFEAPACFADRIYAAFPTVPSAVDPRALREYRDLAERHHLPSRHLTAQIAVLAAARVLVEGLERTGRDLDRRGLIETLEGLVELDTGYLPPITFSPNRRIGLRGAYVVAVDLERRTLVPASGWIEAW